MNYSTYNISLDIHDTASQVSLNVKKGDTARRICAVLTENGKPYKIADGVTAAFRAKKPADSSGNRTIVFGYTQIIDNKICYELVGENTDTAGVADCEFTVYGSDQKALTSPRFTLVIDNTVNEDEEVEVEGKDKVSALTALVSETTALKNEITNKLNNGEFVGERGEEGAVFTPTVSVDGVISWTNDKGLTNPQPVNIKGNQGEPGTDGKDGLTPYVDVTGTWWVGDRDTHIKAIGQDGKDTHQRCGLLHRC